MSRKPKDAASAPPFGKVKLISVDARLLDLPPTPLDRQPSPARGCVSRDVIQMVTLTRLPIVTPKNAAGRRDVLANQVTVLWHRTQIVIPMSSGRRIACIEVSVEDGDLERWQAVDRWCADDLFGWTSKRRSAEVRGGVRGTTLECGVVVKPIREELSRLLKGKAK